MPVPVTGDADAPARKGPGGRPRVPGLTDRILRATIALAARGGIEDLTLDAIAAEAEVGRPTIYRRWPSKEALIADAIGRMLDEHFQPPSPGHVRDQLVEFAGRVIEQVRGPARWMFNAYFNVELAHLASDAMKRSRAVGPDIVRGGIARGELRADTDPELLFELIFAPIWYRSTLERAMTSSFAETLVDTVLRSWLATPPPRRPGRSRPTPDSAG